MRFLPLIAATYFMVSGGPYGIEDILGGAGYGRAIVILLVLPVIWSLPTALMIGELASAIPVEGGFYVWVRRALGPFWGYQESWLSLSASIFDMAIYPAIFVSYLGKFNPALTAGWQGYAWSLALVALCCLWNLRGAPAVGEGSSGWLFALLLAPFAVLSLLGFWHGFSASRCAMACGAHPSPRIATASRLPCGITWAGTTPPPSRRRSRIRSAIIPGPWSPRSALTASPISCPSLAMALAGISAASFSTGDWVDRSDFHRRASARPGCAGRRRHQRSWHVQRPGAELYAPADGHGRGRNATQASLPGATVMASRGSACCSAERLGPRPSACPSSG